MLGQNNHCWSNLRKYENNNINSDNNTHKTTTIYTTTRNVYTFNVNNRESKKY